MKTNLLLAIGLACTIHAFPQISVMNGSFENISSSVTNTTCLQDSAWTLVNNSMGLPGGVQSLIISDPFSDPPCIVAQDGFNYVDLPASCADVAPDHVAFSLELSQPFSDGVIYRVSFYAKKCDPTLTAAPVNIGYSSNAASFGTLIFSTTPVTSDQWTYYEHVFTFNPSTIDAHSLLTLSTESPSVPVLPYSIQIDNIALEEVSSASIENTLQPMIAVYPNPSVQNITVDFGNNEFSGSVAIYDLSGKQIMASEVHSIKTMEIQRAKFPAPGIYLLSVADVNAGNTFQKIVIQ